MGGSPVTAVRTATMITPDTAAPEEGVDDVVVDADGREKDRRCDEPPVFERGCEILFPAEAKQVQSEPEQQEPDQVRDRLDPAVSRGSSLTAFQDPDQSQILHGVKERDGFEAPLEMGDDHESVVVNSHSDGVADQSRRTIVSAIAADQTRFCDALSIDPEERDDAQEEHHGLIKIDRD